MREQMKGLDDLQMGDLWTEARERTPGPQPESPTPRGPVSSRITAGVVAFAVFIAAGVFAWQAFRPGSTTTSQAPADGVAGVALWPDRTAADLAKAQALAGEGNPSFAWRLDPKEVATRFAEDVLGWGPAIPESGGARYVVNLQAAPGSGGSELAFVEPLPVTCESSPVPAIPGGTSGGAGPSSGPCPRPTETEAIFMRQLGTTGETGVWSVTSVNASGLKMDVRPGDVLMNGGQVNGSVTFPSSAGSVPGFTAKTGFQIGTSPGCDLTDSQTTQQGSGALMRISVDPSNCDETLPAGYVWIVTGTDALFAHDEVGDPLRFPRTDVLPFFWGLTIVPFTLSLEQPISATPSEAATPVSVPPCTAGSLKARGGRQGGGFQTAHGDVEFTNTGPSACQLNGVPEVAILRADGTPLPVRSGPPTAQSALRAVVLRPHVRGAASLALTWQNWCGGKPGPLEIAVTLPDGGGTVVGWFNGPPDYDYVPGCTVPGTPSTVRVLYAYSPRR